MEHRDSDAAHLSGFLCFLKFEEVIFLQYFVCVKLNIVWHFIFYHLDKGRLMMSVKG